MVNYEGLAIGFLLLSVLDLILTHFQIFLHQKKGIDVRSWEKTWMPKKILKKFGSNAVAFLIGSAWSHGCLLLIILVMFWQGLNQMILVGVGMFVMLNVMHWYNLIELHDVWKNKEYWQFFRFADAHLKLLKG